MTDPVLQAAIDCLNIREVSLRQSTAWLAEDYDPRFSAIDAFQPQFKHLVERSYLMEVRDGASSYYVFRVFIDLGMRLLPTTSRDRAEDGGEEEAVLAQIEATFVAEYDSQTDPGTEALEAFARQNASYHIWPYWREFVSSQCARMGLPKVTIPTIQVASNGAGASDS